MGFTYLIQSLMLENLRTVGRPLETTTSAYLLAEFEPRGQECAPGCAFSTGADHYMCSDRTVISSQFTPRGCKLYWYLTRRKLTP